MEIRFAQTGDVQGIIALLLQVNEVHHKIRPDLFIHASRKYTGEQLAGIISDPERPILVAAEDGEILGYAFTVLQRSDGPNLAGITTLYLDDLCVDEKARRRGVASALFDAVIAFARERGCHNLTLNVWEGNDSALAFYKSRGLSVQKTTLEAIL